MSLEILSGAAYHDASKTVQKPIPEGVGSEQNTINVTEVSAITKASNSNQTGRDPNQNTASEQQIKEAISHANNKLKGHRTRCEFSYHEETKRVSIKVLDKETQEVIREIPPEETLEMVARMWELAGLLVDEKR